MKFKLIVLILFYLTNNTYSQKDENHVIKLKPLSWDIMTCGNTIPGSEERTKLFVKNNADITIQGYWLNFHNNLVKLKFAKIPPYKTKKLNLKADDYWVFSDLNDNALGVYQTIAGTNKIVIDNSNFENSVKLPTSIQDKSILGTLSGGKIIKEQADYDVLNYDLKLEIFPEKKYIEGQNIITAKTLNPIHNFVFDLDSLLKIKEVFLINKSTKVKLSIETIQGKHWCKLPYSIKKNRTFKISIDYEGNPRIASHAPYQGGFSWNKTKDCKQWIATSCQIDGADLWFPCKDYQWDEPETVNLSFTVPNGLKAISNGVLVNKIKHKNNTITYNWSVTNPINNYDIALNIAPYTHIQDNYKSITNKNIDLNYWVLPENESTAREFYSYSKKYLTFLENHLGPYPFRNEKLGIIEVPFVGMEHQTIIAFGPDTTCKHPEYNATLFHEICHEWFGNLMTSLEFKDLWIHESLDAYMEALYEESIVGEKAYLQKVASFKERLDNKIPLSPLSVMNSREVFNYSSHGKNEDVYNKGAYLLHTLRGLLGKDKVLKTLRLMAYPNKKMESKIDGSQCRFTTTDEFFSILKKVTGQDFNWFKEIYFRNASLPKLSITENKNGVLLRWITKNNLEFPMPLEIKTKKGISKVSFNKGIAQLDCEKSDILEIDPNKWVLFDMSEKVE